MYIKAGLKAHWQKNINSSKVSAISQGPDENPTTFLERLKKTLTKYNNLDLESYEGQDKFLTQPISNIRGKLQKLNQKSWVPLNKMFTIANTIFYNWDQEREARAQEKKKSKEVKYAQILAALVRQPLPTGPSRFTNKDTV